MTKTRSTKSALISSVIALLLCFAMLLGSTFAWFTDSVTSANNIIKSGNLDIELDYWDGENSEWKTVEGTNSLFTNNLWEPGHTEVVYLKLSNLGSLALKYQLAISVLSETEGTNMAGDPFNLSDYIQMGVVEGVNGETNAYADRAVAVEAVKDASGIIGAGYAKQGNMLADAAELYMAVVVYMPETVGNEANAKTGTPAPTINLGVQVLATQMTAESDGFDNQYDEGATFGTYIELEAGADLLAAMASAEADMPLTIKLNGDVEWPTEGHHGENDITPASSIVIDGNGYTITATGSGVTPLGDQTAPMTLKNVKIVDNSVSYNEGAWELTYLEMGGTRLTCENVTFADEIQTGTNATFTNCSFESNEESVYAVWVEDGSATFTGCTFTGYRGLKMHEDYGTEISSVIVKDCTFSDITKKPGIAIGTLNADTTVSITGSTFINCQAGDQGIFMYETDTDVDTINFTENNNIVIGGEEIVDGVYENGTRNYYVYTAEGLQNVFADVIPQNREQSQTVNLMADIDLTGIIWQPIGNMHFTFNGNGHTISNVTCAEGWRSGFFGYAGGVKVNDLTLENVTSAGAQAGTFAGSAEGLTTTNCFLKGTNTVTYVPYENETWGGVGAVTGVVASSNINVTLVEGATVTLNKSGLTTNCPYIDNLTGYLNANSGTVVNNGTVQVIDLAIATAEELFAFAKDVNENGNSYSGKTIALVADIDLNNQAWTPIGQTGATEFKGTFDGQGHTIKNLNVDSSAQTGEHYSSGLFGWVEGRVTIKNVNIDGATVKGNHNVGALLGYTYSAQISNCHVANATIVCIHANDDACGDKAGGIVGYAGNESRFTDCSVSDSTVTAGRDAGQMIGCGYNVSVSNCSATNVTVTAGGDCTGANINESVIGRVM